MKANELFLAKIACMALGSMIRIAYCWKYPVPVRDAFEYKKIIEDWIVTGCIPEHAGVPPLGLYFFKLVSEIINCEILKGGVVVNVIAGVCMVLVLISIVFEITKSTAASLIVGVLSATHPALVSYSCQMTRESIYLLFCSLSICSIIKHIKQEKMRHVVFSSVFAVAAYLCRHEAFELVLVCFMLITFKKHVKRCSKIKNFVVCISVYIISFICISYIIGVPLKYYYQEYTHEIPLKLEKLW